MGGGGASRDRWLLTYADLITLLMVFFVVMFAISEADKGKFQQLSASMQRAFGGGSRPTDTQGQGDQVLPGGGMGLLEAQRQTPPVPARSASPSPSSPLNEGMLGGLATPYPQGSMIEQIRQAILPLAASQGVIDSVTIYTSTEGVIVSLSGNVLFDSGKAELKPEGLAFLHVLADVLRQRSNRLRVEGHTDNVAINTSLYPSNWELSSTRAIVTTRYLVEQGKLAAERIGAAAYGEFRPVADNSTREGRMRNRRVDIVVIDE